MQKHQVQARKKALKYLGLPEDSSLPYTVIALEVAAKDKKVIIDSEMNLTDKHVAAAFLVSWGPH